MHARGVLHGDIRAENVLVAAEGDCWKVMLDSPARWRGGGVRGFRVTLKPESGT
jgi:hypothetical protein